MPDREKYIEVLSQIVKTAEKFNDYAPIEISLVCVKDILELLKEQEAKTVIKAKNMYTGLPITHCPKCSKSLDRYLYGRRQEGEINFCPYCGKAVKW